MTHHKTFPVSFASRRRALLQLGGLGALGLASGLSTLANRANAGAGGAYKALVCVYLTGGNDGNNMVVPTDGANYGQYLSARGGLGTPSNHALALPNAGESGGVLPLQGTRFGLHPAMPEMRDLWMRGNLALLFNAGNLVQPFASTAAYRDNADSRRVPANLFSHLDQLHQTQITSLGADVTTGWAGRLADFTPIRDEGVPAVISAAGNALFLTGNTSSPLVVPQSGAMNFNFFSGDAPSQARLTALQTLIGNPGNESQLVSTLAAQQGDVLKKARLLQSVLAGPGAATMAVNFPDVGTSALSQQLVQVALLIQAAASGAIVAPAQQIFFVELGGFDTHDTQLQQHAGLLAELSSSLFGFFQAMAGIGQADQVVAFTMSDFGRTLLPTSSGGSDHGWGTHHLVVGGAGAVRAGLYGEFPALGLAGPSDVSDRGRWLPTTSIDQNGATLANWLGAGAQAVSAAFPNLRNFTTTDLGFLA